MDCPLCLEEMDISDLNFKPCACGYQICRFCYHHIKENLNGRCPACRAPYDDTTVEFKAIKPDELKRLQAAKKLRDKRRKDEALTVKNLANVRVRQRAQVHIQGMTTKIANEDTLNHLKGPEQFGQYGKVVKLFMSKRSSTVTQPASTHPHFQPVNVYVNYRTPAEASSCISAMDGSTTSDGHKLKAIWGTTRYCPTYLKGAKCNNENCMQAHEPGEEIEGAGPTSREEIYTYHAMSDSDMQRAKVANMAAQARKQEGTLPPTASWASKGASSQPATPIVPNASLPPLSASIKPPPPPRSIPVSKPQTHPLPARPSSRPKPDSTTTTLPTKVAPPPTSTPLPTPSAPVESPRKQPASTTPRPATPVASSSSQSSPLRLVPDPDFAYTNGHFVNGSAIERPPSGPIFPDLEFGDGTFSFSLNLDVKGKGKAPQGDDDENDDGSIASRSPTDFANLDPLGTPGATVPPALPSYIGSFDPFSDGSPLDAGSDRQSGTSSPPPSGDEMSRRGSRFGFARRGSQGVKGGDLASALARSAFASGRESPGGLSPSTFAPPGMPFPPQHRPSSSIGFTPLPPPHDGRNGAANGTSGPTAGTTEASVLWPGVNLASPSFPGGPFRSLASPGQSNSPSPQMSPRSRANMQQQPYASSTPPGINGGSQSPLPPGLSLNRTPIPAAQFPLPPPAPRPNGPSTPVGKDDILALIAAAQASAPKAQHNQENHPFFDPAILSARGGGTHYSQPNGMVGPPSAAYHSLDGGPAAQQQQQQQQHQGYNTTRGFAPQLAFGPPPGVRPPQMGFQQQAYRPGKAN
ncbi:hypothetical protein RQP46_009430 [Phenoliferia psychrophenolica]